METLLFLAALAAVAYWLYRAGKRMGSRKGFNVGRSRRKRRRH